MKKILLFILAFLGVYSCLYGQTVISGKVLDDEKVDVIGASIIIKDTRNGVSTDVNGKFNLSTSKNFPITIAIYYLGYKDKEVVVNNSDPITVILESSTELLRVVNVVEQRLSEKQRESALTVEAMDYMAIKETPAISFYDGLSNLKGVDLTSASIGFKVINTRGFNSTSPVRSLQIIDGVDNQAPGLNFSLGNFLGASELDVLNVDIIAGASSAFYGPNAFNGVIAMRTKNPYDFQGLSASVKVGERNLNEYAIRWAQAFENKAGVEKFAYKINAFYLSADDWEANNLNTVDESNLTDNPVPSTNPGGYDAVNRYGDEPPYDDGGDSKTFAGLQTYHRGGLLEKNLVDYDTENVKLGAALHYRLRKTLELMVSTNYGSGTTVYQGDNRYSLKDITYFRHKIQLERKDKWYIRGYRTSEDAGNSYDAYFTALRMQESALNEAFWANTYRTLWNVFALPKVTALEDFPSFSLPGPQFNAEMNALIAANPDVFKDLHDQNRARMAAGFYGDLLTPGTKSFDSLFNVVTSSLFTEGGSRFYDRSALYHLQGEYKFDPSPAGMFTIGGNYRRYTPDSRGTIFSDSISKITNSEFGVYGGWEKRFIKDKLKVATTMRVDKNENFNFLVSPAASLVYNYNVYSTFRLSVSSAIRNPTLADQYLFYNTGRAVLVGNLEGYDSLVNLDNIQSYLRKAGPSRLTHDFEYFGLDPIKPEQVKTAELGYRTTLFEKVFLDANYYFSWYDDFIGYVIAAEIEEGRTAIDRLKEVDVYRIATNAKGRVTTQGFSVGLNYYFAKHLTLAGNYTWNVLNTQDEDPIVPAFNTPEHKYNISLSARDYKLGRADSKWNIGFNVTYKWIEGFRFEGSPQFTGFIDSYGLLDCQVSLKQKTWNTTMKIGASNVLNNMVYQVYGGPRVGRMAYISFLYDWNRRQ